MYSESKLNSEGIGNWEFISKQFQNSSILLGNGFSINFSESLNYKNLYDFFISDCSNTAKSLFKNFKTTNFEKVLESLEITKKVCDSLNEENLNIELYHEEVRQGLIKSINKIHPKPINVDYEKINKISKDFMNFNQIFTTNYDLFLYYIILKTKKFGDHMFNIQDTKFNYFGQLDSKKTNHIYFLHGALFLFENKLKTLKIKSINHDWLLNSITNEIKNKNYPLFISEGKSESKVKSIQSNSYLSFCFNKFCESKEKKLVIFGHSLSEQDNHIVEAIDENFDKIAISIRPEDWSSFGHLKAEKSRIISLFKNTETEFYDSKTLFNF